MRLTESTLTGQVYSRQIQDRANKVQEYPGADDRGGVDGDGKNFVTFLKELDEVNKKQPIKYVVSFTAPSSYWYLRHFDLKAVDYVTFINVMSYE